MRVGRIAVVEAHFEVVVDRAMQEEYSSSAERASVDGEIRFTGFVRRHCLSPHSVVNVSAFERKVLILLDEGWIASSLRTASRMIDNRPRKHCRKAVNYSFTIVW